MNNMFPFLPYALAQQQNPGNPFASLMRPPAAPGGPPAPLPGSGVGAFLPGNPQVQAMLAQMQQNPMMATAGTNVPQHSWTGSTFNMAPRPVSTTPAIPAAPPAEAAAATGPTAPMWTQGQFTPQAQGRNAYRAPDSPAPGGYVWNSAFGYYQPQKDYDWENNRGGSE